MAIGSYPLEGLAARVLAGGGVPQGWKESGFDRSLYLDLAEPVVRKAVEWQEPSGSVVDPYEGAEPPTISARFVGALAGVIAAGRSLDLLPRLIAGFDYAAEQLAQRPAGAPLLHGADFYAKELAFAYELVKHRVHPDTLERWRTKLWRYVPDEVYTDVISPSRPVVHNFNIYALTGEYWRWRAGLGPAETALTFVESYIPRHFQHFTEYGMYRDPNDPMTYDLTVRQNLSLLLWGGYRGRYRAAVDELLRRGALTTLFLVAPNGQAPFGGRSNQYHHMEGMLACIGEYEAARYARLGDMATAGAFKRLARLAAASTRRWWRMSPWRDLKNAFHPLTRHGREGYGEYSVYSLLAASLYGVAYQLADDSIPEAPMPAEVGGYAVELPGAFHKVFATGGGYHVSLDTRADLSLDATGLGRLVHRDLPAHLGLSMPLCGTPKYHTVPAELRHAAIGPVWRKAGESAWTSLAAQNEATPRVDVRSATGGGVHPGGGIQPVAGVQVGGVGSDAGVQVGGVPSDAGVQFSGAQPGDDVRFSVEWEGVVEGRGRVIQHYRLSPEGVLVRCVYDLPEGYELGFEVPLLLSDGGEVARISKQERRFVVESHEGVYVAECVSPADGVELRLLGEGRRRLERAANRNGVYRVGVFTWSGREREITVRLSLQTKA